MTDEDREALEEYRRRYPLSRRGPNFEGKAVHHLDGDPTNNDPSNIQIVDIKENVQP